jgi:hypothetical protein
VHGEEVLSGTFLNDIASGFDTKAASFASTGKFVSLLSAGLDNVPLNTEITVNKATGVTFAHVVPGQCSFVASSKMVVGASDSGAQKLSADMISFKNMAALNSTVQVIAGATALVAAVVAVVIRIQRKAAAAAEEVDEDESVVRSQRRPFATDVSRRGNGNAEIELMTESSPQF